MPGRVKIAAVGNGPVQAMVVGVTDVVAQHMAPGFIASPAANIGEKSGRPPAEGKDGEILEKGRT